MSVSVSVCICPFCFIVLGSLFLKKKGVNHLQGQEIMQAVANLTQG